LLRRCLEKDSKERLPDIAMARIEIKDALSAPSDNDAVAESKPAPQLVSPNRLRLAWSLAALLSISLVVTVVLWSPWRTPPLGETLRLSSELGADTSLVSYDTGNSAMALSPDGTVMAFVGARNGASQIYIRRLGQLQASPLAG